MRGTAEQVSSLRQTIGRRMVDSLQSTAHAVATVEVDFTALTRLRASVKDEVRAREGIRLNYLPFIVIAVVDALRQHPKINATVDDATGTVMYANTENIGVEIDTVRGTLAPVVKDAGSLDVIGLARAIADLGTRTRAGQITPEDLSGGTFTITNYGAAGTLIDTPIINSPQAAILGVGAIVKRPMVVKDDNVGEVVAIRNMSYLTLSYDRRFVDTLDAARFLGLVKSRLEKGDIDVQFGA
jgi:2-oxoglutarate dehydrogenase E2 component (dihydrolipoamide succinyltransferase)